MPLTVNHRDACREILRQLFREEYPFLVDEFDSMFDVLYETSSATALLAKPPRLRDYGRGGVDPETVRDVGLVSLFLVTTYKLLLPVFAKSAAETIKMAGLDERLIRTLRESRDKLTKQFPKAAKYINLTSYFCERFFENLVKRLGDENDKR